jgi:exo-beta-1,3-glucanase (GH17 family)
VQCVSYTPIEGAETPADFRADRARLRRDFAQLAPLAACVRLYSVRGMEEVPEVAREFGIQVIAGAWVNREEAETEREISGLIAMANRHPDVVSAVLVGNEVLLRRERTAVQLLGYLQRVRAAVAQPVSYGDVWEFWLQNPELAGGVDFVTIHLLPYWEDQPTGIDGAIEAAAHARAQVVAAFPGKDILIGETGWPSEGRRREAAEPGRVNQARFLRGFVAHAREEGWHYNLIEAFDQPWKRAQEGAVGGYWGLFDAARVDKGVLRGTVSDLPAWRGWLAASLGLWLGLLLLARARGAPSVLACAALASGVVYHLQQMTLYSRGPTESAWFLLLAVLALPCAWLWRRKLPRWRDALLLAIAMLACVEALGLVFDPRYRHFPVAVFALPALTVLRCGIDDTVMRRRGRALALLLAGCMPAVLWQETPRNLEALAWLAVCGVMAAGLWRVPSVSAGAARGSVVSRMP